MAHNVPLGANDILTSQILFLCSGNYYRSRFAEILFNHLAVENDLEWRAESRGIVAQWSYNPGPISPTALAELRERNIYVDTTRYPMQLTAQDFASASRTIALYDVEHRPMLETFFPDRVSAVEFWQVPDLDAMTPTRAFALIGENVRSLIAQLVPAPVRP